MSDFNILPPRVAVTDPRTGIMSREWYLFFQQVFVRLGGNMGLGIDEVLQGVSVTATADTATNTAQQLANDAGQAPTPVPVVPDSYWPEYMPPVVQPTCSMDDLAPPIQVGTLGVQNSDNVFITGGRMAGVLIVGGKMDNTPIGDTTRNTGKFTTINTNNIAYIGSYIQIKGTSTTANAEILITTTNTNTDIYASSSSGISKTVGLHANGGAGATIAFDAAGAVVSGYLSVTGTFACNGASPQGSYPLAPAATDLPTALTLLNQIRQMAVNNGIGS